MSNSGFMFDNVTYDEEKKLNNLSKQKYDMQDTSTILHKNMITSNTCFVCMYYIQDMCLMNVLNMNGRRHNNNVYINHVYLETQIRSWK